MFTENPLEGCWISLHPAWDQPCKKIGSFACGIWLFQIFLFKHQWLITLNVVKWARLERFGWRWSFAFQYLCVLWQSLDKCQIFEIVLLSRFKASSSEGNVHILSISCHKVPEQIDLSLSVIDNRLSWQRWVDSNLNTWRLHGKCLKIEINYNCPCFKN